MQTKFWICVCSIFYVLLLCKISNATDSTKRDVLQINQFDGEASKQPDASDYKTLKRSFDVLLNRLDKLDLFYLVDVDAKMASIITSVSGIDAKLRTLQEKAQVWEILHHQMDAIADHIATVDRKLDIFRQNRDDLQAIDGRFTTLEYLLQRHIDGEKLPVVGIESSDVRTPATKVVEKSSNGVKGVKRAITHLEGDSERRSRAFDWQKESRAEPSFRPTYGRFEQFLAPSENEKTPLEVSDIQNASASIATKPQIRSNLIVEPPGEDNEEHHGDQYARNSFEVISEKLQVIDERIFQQSAVLNRINGHVVKLESLNRCDCSKHVILASTTEMSTKKDPGNEQDENNSFEFEVTTAKYENSRNRSDTPTPPPSKKGCYNLKSKKRQQEGYFYFNHTSTLPNLTDHSLDTQLCYSDSDNSVWTVIQRRGEQFQKTHVENFNRSWSDYKHGFGDLSGEFWFGNDLIHQITQDDDVELRISLEDWDGTKLILDYGLFRIESDEYNYNLMIGDPKFGREPLDSMIYHNGQDFSTFDRRNDKASTDGTAGCCSCAVSYGSGWWFNNCIEANLNGIYRKSPKGNNYVGIVWEGWLGDYSLKSTRMMIRSKPFYSDEETSLGRTPPEDP